MNQSIPAVKKGLKKHRKDYETGRELERERIKEITIIALSMVDGWVMNRLQTGCSCTIKIQSRINKRVLLREGSIA